MPDSTHVGRRYEAPGQVIDPDRVTSFARAVEGGDGVADLGPVPPTYAAVYCMFPALGQLFVDPDVGIDLTGLVHGEQSFEWHAPVEPGDVVDASAEIAAVEEKRGRLFVTLDLQAVRSDDGERVLSGRSLFIVPRGTAE